MDEKIKSLIAIGAAVNANCLPCMQHHVQEALMNGATQEELAEAVKIGKKVREYQVDKMDALAAKLTGEAPADQPCETANVKKCCC